MKYGTIEKFFELKGQYLLNPVKRTAAISKISFSFVENISLQDRYKFLYSRESSELFLLFIYFTLNKVFVHSNSHVSQSAKIGI